MIAVDTSALMAIVLDEPQAETCMAAIEAADGASGLRALRSAGRVDLLVTDVGLPGGMNGRQVADAARQLRPGLKVLFITGYAHATPDAADALGPGMALIGKPFALDALASKVRGMIEG